jgi:daunorubicin resistance ABC transporter ATP-binding subunit
MTEQNGLAVEARGLVKRFGEVRALDGVDLEVPRGTVLGLLGPNGAGKTTAVRILATIITPDEGEARVLGHEVVREAEAVRMGIGLAGQFAAIDGNLTGRENLTLIGSLAHLPRRSLRPRADELLERFGLSDAAGRLARTYSGGMRRRLDLAAALVHRPPVLFLDEPTAGLDPVSRVDLWTVVRELVAEGTTVLLTTQYLEEADQLADRIVVVDHGRAIAEGTAAELKARLGATVVELEFADEGEAAEAAEALRPLELGRLDCDGTSLRLSVSEGAKALMSTLRAFDARGIEPRTAAVREPSLDDVFLNLTGRRAEPQAEDEAPEAPPADRREDRVPEEVA